MAGICEVDPYGEYQTQAECEQECTAQESKDVMEIILQYDYGTMARVAPSDRTRLLQRETGIRFEDPFDTHYILEALDQENLEALVVFFDLLPYLERKYSLPEILEVIWLEPHRELAEYLVSHLDKEFHNQVLIAMALMYGNAVVAGADASQIRRTLESYRQQILARVDRGWPEVIIAYRRAIRYEDTAHRLEMLDAFFEFGWNNLAGIRQIKSQFDPDLMKWLLSRFEVHEVLNLIELQALAAANDFTLIDVVVNDQQLLSKESLRELIQFMPPAAAENLRNRYAL